MAKAHLLTLSHKDLMSSRGPKKGSRICAVDSGSLLKFDKTLLIYFLY
jgi:hypothetical protein